ncbi:hypothetical protein KCP69_24290 [Salmonella enterica subsp. enterica]|nr:hypothetical protein KCP69_24290 [Salmonella enterica subsp. enterica]
MRRAGDVRSVVDIDAARMVSHSANRKIASVVVSVPRAVKSASTYDFTHQPSRRRSTVNRRKRAKKSAMAVSTFFGERLSQRLTSSR